VLGTAVEALRDLCVVLPLGSQSEDPTLERAKLFLVGHPASVGLLGGRANRPTTKTIPGPAVVGLDSPAPPA
jgi:hypothetical protein